MAQANDKYQLMRYWMQREGVSQRDVCRALDLAPPTVHSAIHGSNETTFSRIVEWFVSKHPKTGLTYEDFYPIDDPMERMEKKIDEILKLIRKEKNQ
jgi:hypothetical protein